MLVADQNENCCANNYDLSNNQIYKFKPFNFEKFILNLIDNLLNRMAEFEITSNCEAEDIEVCASFFVNNI